MQASEIDLQAVIDVPDPVVDRSLVQQGAGRETCWELLSIRDRKPHVVFDLDYRANFWPSREEATADISPVLDHVTVAVGNRTECEVAVGSARSARGGTAPAAIAASSWPSSRWAAKV